MAVEYPNEVPSGLHGKWLRERYGTSEDGPMTLSQASYLMTLCEETGNVMDDSLNRVEAAQLIQELERATGRGPQGPLNRSPV